MNFEKVINHKKKTLIHGTHGGEIYDNDPIINNKSLLDFSTNINPFVAPDIIKQACLNSLNLVARYPDSNSTKLKEELLNYFENKISIENLIVGAGSMKLISLFCDMFINPNDEIIISQPTFSEYEWAVRKNAGKIVNIYRKPENNFRIEYKPIVNNISSKTKAIFICNPNNPNGYLDDSKELIKIINEASKNDVLILLDEVFIEFTGEFNSCVFKISSFDNLFICRSFTKFFGLTGLRVGFGVSTPEIIEYITCGQVLWPVNCFGQSLAIEMLKSKKFIEDSLNLFFKEREFIENELKKIHELKIFPSHANFFLINLEKTGIRSTKLKEELLKENILIRDCSNYNGLNDYYIRISVKTRESNLKLINSLKRIIKSHT